MKTALITTTVNVPTVLELYRQHGPDVAFFVAGDAKTPSAAYEFCETLPNCHWFMHGEDRGWRCDPLIGPNSIQRRNIALLEAVKWGADIIVSVDDDNIPIDTAGGFNRTYFQQFDAALFQHDGIKVSSPTGWFDVGQLLDPIAPHRGFPISIDGSKYEVSHVTNAKVGIAAGICLGDPDISAVVRIARGSVAHRVSELLNSGIVVDPGTHTVFNSQNTAFICELAPAFFMLPGVGRYDDIYASLIMQRVMRERGLHVHFGKPFVWQSRNPHNLVKDLRGEIDGMEHIEELASYLDSFEFDKPVSTMEIVKDIHAGLSHLPWMPQQTVEAALAFLADMEEVL